MPPALAIQTIGSAIHHFSEAFKLSRDKQAFYECILVAVPAGQFIPHTYVCTYVHLPVLYVCYVTVRDFIWDTSINYVTFYVTLYILFSYV